MVINKQSLSNDDGKLGRTVHAWDGSDQIRSDPSDRLYHIRSIAQIRSDQIYRKSDQIRSIAQMRSDPYLVVQIISDQTRCIAQIRSDPHPIIYIFRGRYYIPDL